jgi:hypothetical protein
VRRAAARAVERWSGERIDHGAAPAERRRTSRRIAERLLALDRGALREAVAKVPLAPIRSPAGAAERQAAPPAAARRPPSPPPVDRAHGDQAHLPGEGVATAAAPAPARSATATFEPALAEAALAEVRAALRGRSAAEIAAALGADPGPVEGALRALVAQGRIVPRGPRFFMS